MKTRTATESATERTAGYDSCNGTATGDDLLTLDELAHKLKLHPVTVRGLKRRGVIPALKLGHRTLRFEYAKVLDALRQAGDTAGHQAE